MEVGVNISSICNEERFDTIFKAMDGADFPPQKVFFEGKHYDAYSFARKLVRKATKIIWGSGGARISFSIGV